MVIIDKPGMLSHVYLVNVLNSNIVQIRFRTHSRCLWGGGFYLHI